MRPVRAGALLVVLSVLLVWRASAWGCVPQPFLSIGPLASGPVGAQVTVQGTDFSGDVEIRWNGVQGPLLGEGAGEEFSVPVTIPDVAVGLYLVVGVNRDDNGNVRHKGAASFEVTTAANTTPTRPDVAVEADSQDGGPSGMAVAGLALGSLAVATVGGFVGAALWQRRSSSPAPRPKSS